MRRILLLAGLLAMAPTLASAQVTGSYVGYVQGVHSINGETLPMQAQISLNADFSNGTIQATVQGFAIGDGDEYSKLVLDIGETPILEDLRISSVARNVKSATKGSASTFGQWNLTGNLAGRFQKLHIERVPRYLTGYFRAQDILGGQHWVLTGIFLAESVN